MRKIVFITSQFPETHETFILREFNGLERAGVPFEIVSLKACKDKVVHPEALGLTGRTYTVGRSPRAIARGLGYWMVHPLRSLKVLSTLVAWGLRGKVSWPAHLATWVMIGVLARRYGKVAGDVRFHAHWATIPSTVACLLGRTLGVPFSMTAHAWDIYRGDGLLEQKVADATFVVTCTGYNRRHLAQLKNGSVPGKVYLNYHGLDFSRIPWKDNYRLGSPPRVLAVGRLVEQKGFIHLVDAMAECPEPFETTIIGSGPLHDVLVARATELGVADRLTIIPTSTQAEVLRRMQESDVFAAPSVIAGDGDRDGIPNVILEAMAVGLPVVGSHVSGIPEVVLDNQTGLAVEPGDSGALSWAIARLCRDESLRRKVARGAHQRVEKLFTIETNVEQLVGIFKGDERDSASRQAA